ncbi:potassium channel family protein [Ilyobacter polytropus]|uniref:TrkA-N domain protein n=1 Tax=Ilyobacter polytropus (strain ATCC 51220 / DSM 2926 / LMG 16218 / CuHBu1) TaxID=572544 RepID=E3H6H9_ILYPC|nr:TrkA family potassium uptake protein [Ilyobacter polytropus]ADO82392.1 TrkA-N domain protein [Ilyobacter polytropus DSM 2926]
MAKQYLVIGLGRFGTSVAKTLYEAGEDVLAVDIDEDLVQEAVNNSVVDNAVTLDVADERAMKEIGAGNFDVAFVCIGSKLQSSIIITLILQEMGVKNIIAKAVSKSHGKVLGKIGATKVIYPEEYMGKRVALLAMEPNMIEHLRFSQDFLLVEIKAPSIFWDKTLMELGIRNKYNVNIVGIKKGNGTLDPTPRADSVIEKDDILLVITDAKTAKQLEDLK